MWRRRHSELRRWLGDPDQQTALEADTKWPGAEFLLSPAALNGFRHQLLRGCGGEV